MQPDPLDTPQPLPPVPAPALPHKRRPRYSGKNPRRFTDKYKEHNPALYPETIAKVVAAGKTPAGSHRPILVAEILEILQPQPGAVVADCTLGYGGHAREILAKIQPNGRLIGLDIDPIELPKTEVRLRALGFGPDRLAVYRSNFAGLPKVLAAEKLAGVDLILADLGVSSMQLDDPGRGFSVKLAGPLDMRMNPQRGQPAAALLERTTADMFLRNLPTCLAAGGRVAILTFHSGEDRRVKKAFAAGLATGDYSEIATEVIRPSPSERHDNPRSSSAKLRWARKSVA